MDNVEIVEGAFHEILKRAQTGAPDAGLPVVRKPESWREHGIELTYHEGCTDQCAVDHARVNALELNVQSCARPSGLGEELFKDGTLHREVVALVRCGLHGS